MRTPRRMQRPPATPGPTPARSGSDCRFWRTRSRRACRPPPGRSVEVWNTGTVTAPVTGSGSCPTWIALVAKPYPRSSRRRSFTGSVTPGREATWRTGTTQISPGQHRARATAVEHEHRVGRVEQQSRPFDRLADAEGRQPGAHHVLDRPIENAGVAERRLHDAKFVDRTEHLRIGQRHLAFGHRQLGDAVLVHEQHRITQRVRRLDVDEVGARVLFPGGQHVGHRRPFGAQETESGHPLVVEDPRQVAHDRESGVSTTTRSSAVEVTAPPRAPPPRPCRTNLRSAGPPSGRPDGRSETSPRSETAITRSTRDGIEGAGPEVLADALDQIGAAPNRRRTPTLRGRRPRSERRGSAPSGTWPTPVIVPPVPTPATKCVTLPAVCRQISGPVVR